MGFSKDSSMLKNLNSILLGAAAFVLLIVVLIMFRLLKRWALTRRIYDKISRMLFFGAIHQTINTASLPIQVTSMFELQRLVENGASLPEMASSFGIVSFFALYPVIMYHYIKRNLERARDATDTDFHARHGAALNSLKM